jgi:hypothetical protein
VDGSKAVSRQDLTKGTKNMTMMSQHVCTEKLNVEAPASGDVSYFFPNTMICTMFDVKNARANAQPVRLLTSFIQLIN